MTETRNIVIVGGSTAGLGAAHSFLKHTAPALKTTQPSVKYVVHVVEPSSHYWWRVSAPRAMVSTSLIPHEKTFLSIAEGFKQYDKDAFVLHQATATAVDTAARTVTFEYSSGSGSKGAETIPYYSLVIATGMRTGTKLTTIYGTHDTTVAALDAMNERLKTAKSVVIGGGGPVAVETAGEIGDQLNGMAGFFSARPANQKAKITLVTSSENLLPVVPKSFTPKAEKFLNKVGVDVLFKTSVQKVELSAADAAHVGDASAYGKTTGDKSIVHLSNGETLECDVYIPALGVKPNTEFLPPSLLNEKGYVKSDPKTLRVTEAGERVYALGDCGDYTKGGFISLLTAVPTLTANLAKDLDAKASAKKDKEYALSMPNTQLVPIGKSKGLAVIKGFGMPSAMCWAVKGRDFMVGNAAKNVAGTAY